MTWGLALGYAGAAAAMVAALLDRTDPIVEAALDPGGEHRPARRDLLAALGRRLATDGMRGTVRRRLPAGDAADAGEVDRVIGVKGVLAAAGAAFGALAFPGGAATGAAAAAALGVGGFSLPDFVLARRAVAHSRRVGSAVPELLDLVAMGVGAGLTPRLALERATDVIEGTLRRELERARREVSLGGTWPSALRRAAARSRLLGLVRLAAAIERGSRLGAPLAGTLRDLARDARDEHHSRQEERARRAPVAMLFPLVFLILPAFVVAAVVPAVIVATRGIQ